MNPLALALLAAVAAFGLSPTSSAAASTTKPGTKPQKPGTKPQKPGKPGDGNLEKEAQREAAKAKAKEAADREAARIAAEAQARQDAKDKAAAEKAARDKATAEKAKDKPTTKPAPKPSPGAVLLKLGVEAAQKALNSLGARLVVDDLYGPKTAAAWAAEAQRRGLIGDFLRVDRNTAHVDKNAYAQIYAASVQAQKAREAASAPAPSTPALEPRPEPAKPNPVPSGYQPDKARSGARALAAHLTRTGRANYDRRLLKQWQTWAGLKPDGLYGGKSRGALLFYGAKDAPQPFVKPVETQPYVPPG